jgi:hypothetical protein
MRLCLHSSYYREVCPCLKCTKSYSINRSARADADVEFSSGATLRLASDFPLKLRRILHNAVALVKATLKPDLLNILCVGSFSRRSQCDTRPHPGPLPRGEGESFAAFWQNQALDSTALISQNRNRPMAVPSPGGEGQGEGGRQTIISVNLFHSILELVKFL